MKKITVMSIIVIMALSCLFFLVPAKSQSPIPLFAPHFGPQPKIYSIPVYIEDTYEDINAIIFTIQYNNTALKLIDVENGGLNSNWDNPTFYCPEPGRCNISMVYGGVMPLPAHSSGDIALLKFKVLGKRELTPTTINFSNIQLSNTTYVVGTAPSVCGTISTQPMVIEQPAYWN